LAAKYDEDEFDQQNCPHCEGNGTLGHNFTAKIQEELDEKLTTQLKYRTKG